MTKKIAAIILLGIITWGSCKRKQQETPFPDSPKWKFEKLSEKKELFLNNDSIKGGMKLDFEFNYPSEFENDSILRQIQSIFVQAFAGEEYKSMPPKIAFDTFLKKAVDEGVEMGNMAADDGVDFSFYFRNISTTVFDTTNICITIQTVYENYTGGAHGSYNTSFYNIDTRDGKILNEAVLFKKNSQKYLTELIKETLTDTVKMGKVITLFDPEDVSPNGNFYFDHEGIVYIFNRYEIAPYSDGLIEVKLPYSKIEELIAPEYQKIIALKTKTE